jgi:hypothetical protein
VAVEGGSAGAGGRFAGVGEEKGLGEAIGGGEEGWRRQFDFFLLLPFLLSGKLNGTVGCRKINRAHG